ncbi:ACP S-malonyltransferase [Nonomuraea zeae]|uniref:[acyl-carrier-protein] S-malonyltransferase n=1 Tax=Nonomuraea zeae TaxID=1642303 RepID=A0A5S4FYW3_9ACTN|nr:ACP S-malonyltransferase [Nonomuraea zeae]TMR25913.1 ACP S-malonyltransferase [Nonomuraea zeae]
MLVLVAPGQGTQTPGFLTPWLDLPGVPDRLAEWSGLIGLDLIRYGTTAGADEIRDTAVAQPLLVAAALVAAEALGITPGLVAGHSVGEFAAAALAGVLTPAQALTLVRERGRAMAEAAAATGTTTTGTPEADLTDIRGTAGVADSAGMAGAAGMAGSAGVTGVTGLTGMTAVLGGDEQTVLAALHEHGLTPANRNGAGQIVAGGTLTQLAALAAAKPAGTRLIPLRVAGAFHTAHMLPAVAALRAAAASISPRDPRIPLLSNGDGTVVTSGADAMNRLIAQVANPVRWDACMAEMSRMGVTTMIELPPAGTLTGLARRELPGITTVALKTPAHLTQALATSAPLP